MNKIFTAFALSAAAAATTAVTVFALGTGINSERITADLTLIENGEFIDVHFSPSFEEKMTEKEKTVYSALEKGIFAFEHHIDIAAAGYTDADELTSFLNHVINIKPDWNRIDDEVVYVTQDGTITQILLNYATPELMLAALGDEYSPTQTEIDHALADIKEGMTDVEKALIIHDYLVREVDYSLAVINGEEYSQDVFTLKGVFVDHEAVCQGYALAYSYLLEKVGVESMIVSSEEMNHAWNMLKVNGTWYHVDVTWDDPTNSTEVDFCRGGFIRHDYFLRSDEEFRDELEHYGWEQMNGHSAAPEAAVSNSFDGWCFRPIVDGTEVKVGMLSYVDGYFYGLSDMWGSNILVKSKVDGTDKTEMSLPETLKYVFYFKGKFYGSSTGNVYELSKDGSVERIVAASSALIRNFWLKQDVLAYYEVEDNGNAKLKLVDLEKGADNIISENGFTFVIDDNGNATLVEYKGEGGNVLRIPASVAGYPVTKIGKEVFKSYRGAEKLIIPVGVVSIADRAFMYSEFREIVLPTSLVSIGDQAFFNCNYIGEIHIPKNVSYLGAKAFYACFGLETVYFHDDVPEYWGLEVFGKIEQQIELKHHSTRWGWSDGIWVSPNGVEFKSSLFGAHVTDVNHDGIANAQDIAFVVNVYTHPEEHDNVNCPHKEECDCNGDGTADSDDAIYMLWELIHGFDD